MVSGSLGSVGGESGVPLITFTLNYDVSLDIRVHLSFQDLPGPISNRCSKLSMKVVPHFCWVSGFGERIDTYLALSTPLLLLLCWIFHPKIPVETQSLPGL